MPNVTYSCPNCQSVVRCDVTVACDLHCPSCAKTLQPPRATINESGVKQCLICSSPNLFVRKDFPQRIGVLIVVFGFAASCIAWFYYQVVLTFAILFITALIDVVLYLVMGEVLECYRCHAQYRGLDDGDHHEPFELETHERYRQQAARMEKGHQANVISD